MAASIEIKNLMKKKEEIESEIKALYEVLDSQKGVGIKEPLIDTEGYPRSDIDVYTVRHARHKICCLQNDHKDIMKEIEEELYRIHAEARLKKVEPMEEDSPTHSQAVRERLSPFATVNKVDDNSPASLAGLHSGDEVLRFGSVTVENFQGMGNIATVVQHSKDKPLNIRVRRGEQEFNLSLTPKTWSGRGLLGCNIVPVKNT